MLYLLSALSVMYVLLMYYISLLLLLPDGFLLCYIRSLVLTLWRFDDDVISPSPGMGRYTLGHTFYNEKRTHWVICSKSAKNEPTGHMFYKEKRIHWVT